MLDFFNAQAAGRAVHAVADYAFRFSRRDLVASPDAASVSFSNRIKDALRDAAEWVPDAVGAFSERVMLRPIARHWVDDPSVAVWFPRATVRDIAWTAEQPHLDRGRVRTYTWTPQGKPDAPAVLLVHGWTLSARAMVHFVRPLLKAGFRVVAVDLPAHGKSSGEDTDFLRSAAAMRHVSAECGPFYGVIAHSFGGSAVGAGLLHRDTFETPALPEGHVPKAAALMAAPGSSRYVFELMVRILRLGRVGREAFWQRARAHFGEYIDFDLSDTLPAFVAAGSRLRIVQDAHDQTVLRSEGARLAECHSGIEFVRTQHLGHMGILSDPDIVVDTVRFIAEAPSA